MNISPGVCRTFGKFAKVAREKETRVRNALIPPKLHVLNGNSIMASVNIVTNVNKQGH